VTRVAVFQMTAGIDPAANAELLTGAIGAAAMGGAAMVFTPEMSGLIDRDRARATPHIVAENRSEVLMAVREAAAKAGVWAAIGSIPVLREDGRWANRAFVVDSSGAIAARYDKIHMFDVDLDTGESWRESAAYAPGEAVVAGAFDLL
jgi:predicted amidohydrolase